MPSRSKSPASRKTAAKSPARGKKKAAEEVAEEALLAKPVSVTPTFVSSGSPSKSKAAAPAAASAHHQPAADAPYKFTPEKDGWDGKWEFGGPLGALGMIVFSHFIMYYFWACIMFFDGELVLWNHPKLQGKPIHEELWRLIVQHACPTYFTLAVFWGYLFFEYVLAVILPGPVTHGLPLPSENGHRVSYKCNAVYAWYILLATIFGLHYSGIYRISEVSDHFGHYMTAAVITGNAVSVICYISGFLYNKTIRMSGNHIYDFFMGSSLNPTLPFGVDLKLFAELRNSWTLLFILTLSSAVRMYEDTGKVTTNMALLVLAQFLYSNACQKGEECVPTTFDIFYEKFGWMLIFWNTAGVPFVYCFQSLFILKVVPTLNYSWPHAGALLVFLLFVYWMWDTINSQKNRFRMLRHGVPEHIIRRKTFPQLPWGYIPNPKTLKSERGELLVDGWYQFGRKMHYTADLCMSFFWGYMCGLTHFIPFFYFSFFLTHLVHRTLRDEHRCAEKYGPLWQEYIKRVPYRFIPGVW